MVLSCGIIQPPIVYAHPPPCHCSCWNKLILLINNDSHSPFLRHYLHWTDPWAVRYRVDDPSLTQLQDFLLNNLLHCGIQSSLRLTDRPCSLFQEYSVLTNLRADAYYIRQAPPNCFLVPSQHTKKLVLLLGSEFPCNDNWELLIILKVSVLEVGW